MNSSVHLCVQSEESTAQWIIKSVSHSKHQWEIPKPQQWPSQSKKEHLVLIIGYHLLPFHICWWCFINLVITSLSPQTPPFRMRYSLYTHSKLTISTLHHCLLRYYLHSPARERRWERESMMQSRFPFSRLASQVYLHRSHQKKEQYIIGF